MGFLKLKNNQGITIIALVVTIIIMLILIGVSASIFFNNNGILRSTIGAADDTEKMEEKKELAVAIADYYMLEGNLKPVGLSRYLQDEPYNFSVKDSEKVTEETPQLDVTVRKYEFEVITDPGATETIKPGDINGGTNVDDEKLPGGEEVPGGDTPPGGDEGGEDDGNGSVEDIDFEIKLAATSYSVTVEVLGGHYDNFTYKYFISDSEDIFLEYIPGIEPQQVFEKLTHDKNYYIKVEITDGTNTAITKITKIRTNKIPDVDPNEIMWSPTSATNQNVAITSIYQKDKYSLVYKIEGNEPQEYTQPIILEENSKVVFYMQDESGQKGTEYEVNIDYIDKVKPIIINAEENGSLTNANITFEDIGTKVQKIALIEQNSAEPYSSEFVNIEGNYETIQETYDEGTNKYTQVININNLTKNRAYFIWAQDSAGNITETYYLYCTANLKVTEDIILSTESMVNTKITAWLPVRTGLKTEYKIFYEGEEITEDKINQETNWNLLTTDDIEITENCTIYCRYNFLDLVKGDYISKEITNIDRVEPTIKQVGSTKTTATILCTDNQESGIDKIAWTAIQAVPKTWDDATEKVTIPVPENGYMYVYLKDKAGNMSIRQVYSGTGINIGITNLGITDVKFELTANDERINKIGNKVYWYVGKSETAPENIEEYVLMEYEEIAKKVYEYTEGEENTEYYVHVKDDNGNEGSLKFKFNKLDNKGPDITYSVYSYYPNNQMQDIKVTLEDELSAIKTIIIYDENKAEIAQIDVAQVGETYTEYIKIKKSEDLKQVELIITQIPPTKGYIKAIDIKENESIQKEVNFNGDYEKPTTSFTASKYYKNEGTKLIDGYLSLQDNLSGLKEATITYIDASGKTQTITRSQEDLKNLKETQLTITGIKNDTNLTITAKDNCENILNTTIKIEGDFEGPTIVIDNTRIQYKEETTTEIMYATNASININDGKSGLESLLVEYIDKDGKTQTITEDNISTADNIVKSKTITVNNFKINTTVTVTSTDCSGNSSTNTYTLGAESIKPTINIKNRTCKIDKNNNKIIEFTILIEDNQSGLATYTITSEKGTETVSNLNGKRSSKELSYSITANSSIKIEATDLFSNREEVEIKNFTDDLNPTVTILEEYNFKDIKISVNVKDIENDKGLKSGIKNYKISYILNEEETELVETELTETTYELTSEKYEVPNGAIVKAIATDNFGNICDEVTIKVYDYDAPKITIDKSNTQWNIEDEISVSNIVVNINDEKAGIDTYTIEYTDKTGTIQTIEKSNLNTKNATYTINDVKVDTEIKVTAKDGYGNEDDYSETITREKQVPTITVDTDSFTYYKNNENMAYVEFLVSVSDEGKNQSGLKYYSIEYKTPEGTEYKEYKKEILNGEEIVENIKVQVPNDSTIQITVEDRCENPNSRTINVGDTEKPQIKGSAVYNSIEYINGIRHIKGTITVTDSKSGLYSYKINNGQWVEIPPSGNQYLKEYTIPFEGDQNEIITITVKDYFNNEFTHNEQLKSENDIIIQNVNITAYNPVTKKISGNATISSAVGLTKCFLVDEKGEIIQTKTSDVNGKTQCVITFNEIENGFYIEVWNRLEYDKKSELIGDKTKPEMVGKTITPFKDTNGQLKVDINVNVKDSQAGLYKYKIILGENENDWQEIPKTSGKYSQQHTIDIEGVVSGTQVKIYVQDAIGNEAIIDLGIITVQNDIEIKNINYTNWDVENATVSGTLNIQAAEKGLKDCKIIYDGKIIGTPYEFNGSKKQETITFTNIPNGSIVIVTNQWNETKEDDLGDFEKPVISIKNVEYNKNNSGKNIVTIEIQDQISGLKTAEVYYISSTGEEQDKQTLTYSGDKDKKVVTLEIPNDTIKVIVNATDIMNNGNGKEFDASSGIADREGPSIQITANAYIIEEGNKYITGEVHISDTKSGLKSYTIKCGENIIASENNLEIQRETVPFKVLNNSTIEVVAFDHYNNNQDNTATFSDNEKPIANYEIVELIKDDSDNEFVKIKYSFADGKSHLKQYSIEIDGVQVEGAELNSKDTYSGYYLVPNNSKVKITVSDNFGNINEELEFNINIDSELFPEIIPQPADAIVTPTGWTEENVTVTMEKHERFILQYRINNTGDYTTYNEPLKIPENCLIEYRYYKTATKEAGPSKSVRITNIDKEAPVVTVTSRNVSSVYVNATDAVSGVVQIAVTETKDLPEAQDWIIVSMKSDGSLSDTGVKESNEIVTDLTFGTVYYAWAVDASGKISEPVEFVTSVKEIGTLQYSPTHITNEYVTITLPKDATLKTTYQVVYSDETFDENDTWTEYTSPFTVEENCVIYYRYEFDENVGNYATFHITNIDKTGPVVDFAIMIDDTLNIEYTDDNNILGYAIKEENVTPTEYEVTEYSISKGNKYFALNELTNIETDKSYYIWLIDEIGNISEESMEFRKVKVGPNNTFKGYTNEEVPIEVYIPEMKKITVNFKFDEGVNQELKDYVISNGLLVEDIDIEMPITDGSGKLNASIPLSATIKFKATVGEKTSREYTLEIHNIDRETPETTILEQTITSLKLKAEDKKVGLAGLAVLTQNYDFIYYNAFVRDDFESLDELTEEEIKNIPKQFTTDEITLTPNTEYRVLILDMFENTNEMLINTYIEIPTGGKYTPEIIVNNYVTVQLPTKEYTKLSGEKLKYTTQYRIITDEGEGEWTNYTSKFDIGENCKIEYRYEYQGYYGESAELVIKNIDKKAPITTIKGYNSYSVLINAVDDISGVKGYYISTNSETPAAESFNDWGTEEADKLISNLTPASKYYVWTIDNIGNISNSVSFETKIPPLGEATLSNSNWTNQNITATLPKDTMQTTYTEYQIIYKEDTFNENDKWTKYTAPITISENCVIFYRYNDGNEAGQYGTLNVTNIDKVVPTFNIDYVLMDNSIKLTSIDELSGTAGYIISTSSTGNKLANMKSATTENITIADLKESTTYYIWVVDKAGNISEKYEKVTMGNFEPKTNTTEPVTVTLPQIAGYKLEYQIDATETDGWIGYTENIVVETNCAIFYRYIKDTVVSYVNTFNVENIQSEFTVNPPKLSNGMIPIKHNGTNWVVCSENDEEWYNYVDQAAGVDGTSKWANVMLSDGYYKAGQVEVGTTVEENQLGSMFVWIPRYAYAITDGYHAGGTDVWGTIQIAFLQGTNNYSTGDAIEYSYQGTKGEAVLSNASGSLNWNEHPAFTFGDTVVSGIWIAKFQASMSGSTDSDYNTVSTSGCYGGTSEILKIQPGVTKWRCATISQIVNTCTNMNSASTNIYGIISDKKVVAPHLMKNTEWGAIAYLTVSSYGRNGNEITYVKNVGTYTNPYSTSDEKIDFYNKYFFNTGMTIETSYEPKNYITAPYTSSTGNITGIYDMSGFAYETVAAGLSTSDTLKNDEIAFWNLNYVYRDSYKSGASDDAQLHYNANVSKYGDAMYETSSDYTAGTGDCNTNERK